MIDVMVDELLTLEQAADSLAGRLPGQEVSGRALHRWAAQGLRGHVLETARVGRRRYTTARALAEFCSRTASVAPRAADPGTGGQAVDGPPKPARAATPRGPSAAEHCDRMGW